MSSPAPAKEVPLGKKIISSGLAGAIATTCIYPIDITKTKLMDQKGVGKAKLYAGPIDCFLKIFKADGIKGLYRGWPPNVLFVMPEKALKLTMNDLFRAKFRSMNPQNELTFPMELLAGGLAGFCQVIMTNPMELLKIQGATQNDKIREGTLKEKIPYTTLCRQLGVSGLYTGVVATLLRDVPFSMLYFSLYSQTAKRLTGFSDLKKAFIAGAVAGTIAAGVTCPIDVVKTRVHSGAKPEKVAFSEYWSREFMLVRTTVSSIIQKEGAGAFFKGIIPRCIIISPLFAITMTCYEKFQKIL